MIDTNLRKHVQPLFNVLSKGFIRVGITPTQLTVAGFIFGLAAGALVASNQYLLAAISLIVSGILDVLDGSVARLTKSSSKKGAFLDLIFDRMVESSIIIGFYLSVPEHGLLYLIFLVSVIFNFSTFMAAGALWKNDGKKSMHYDIGIIERTETFIAFFIMLLIPSSIFMTFLVLNTLIFLTGIIRSIRIVKDDINE